MWIQSVLFYVFSVVAIASAGMVVISANPVRSVLFLVLTFFAAAGLWMLAQAEFLSLILILVYVGAVMTLFLFVIMMLDIEVASRSTHFVRYMPLGIAVFLFFILLLFYAIQPEAFSAISMMSTSDHPINVNNVQALGQVLYTQYVYDFELAAAILFVAIVAAITLAYRGPRECRTQNIRQQIQVKRSDRVRLVDMPAEKRE